MPSGTIPEELSSRLGEMASEAKVLLGVMRGLRDNGELSSKVGAELYRTAAAKFKRSASLLSARFDTLSYLVDADSLSSLASSVGCSWDAKGRRLVVG